MLQGLGGRHSPGRVEGQHLFQELGTRITQLG
jgi:hypothetical protein